MLKANYPDDIHTLQSIVRTSFDDIVWANLIAEQRAILRSAYLIRCVEEGFLDAFAGGRLNGTVHTCIGQEFVGVCVDQYLVDGDWVTSNHVVIDTSSSRPGTGGCLSR